MPSDLNRMLDDVVAAKKSRDDFAAAQVERARKERELVELALKTEYEKAYRHFLDRLKSVDEAVIVVNEKSMQTGIVCDQSDWKDVDHTLVRCVNFHSNNDKESSILFMLNSEGKIVSRIGNLRPAEFLWSEFTDDNVNRIFTSHFATLYT